MKKKLMYVVAAGMLGVAGLSYGFSSNDSSSCPLEGTPECPKANCPLKGTPECPYDAQSSEVPSCCQK